MRAVNAHLQPEMHLGLGETTVTDYLVIFEKAGDNYSAYVPDLPGCITTGKTLEETECNIKEAIGLYLDTLRADGKPIPEPTTKAKRIFAPSKRPRKRSALPPKGTGARLLMSAGAWSFMTDEEIEQIKKDIFGSRRSRPL